MKRDRNVGSRRHAGVMALLGLALVAQGCGATPTEPEVTLDVVSGQFDVYLTSTSATGGVQATGYTGAAAFRPALTEPTGSEIEVPFPGTPTVFSWPVIQDLQIAPYPRSNGELELGWPHLSEQTWPDLDSGPEGSLHFGNAWMIYPVGNRWIAETVEWLRSPHERTGTVFHPDDKLTVGHPDRGDPVAFFVAGPSRHSADRPEYRRRTEPKWYSWGDFSRWVWDEPEQPEEPEKPEEPEPEVLEEVHVWILAFAAEQDGGTRVSFNKEVGDVELLSLDGRTVQVVDAEVPQGTYGHVAFTIDEGRSHVVFGGDQQPLSVPDGEVRVNGPFVVSAETVNSVTLHFDTEQSLTQNADGSWSLNPVVVLTATGSQP